MGLLVERSGKIISHPLEKEQQRCRSLSLEYILEGGKAETRLILNMLSAEIGNNDGFPKGIFDSDLNVKKFPTSGFDLTEINDLKEAIKCMIGLSKYSSKFEYYHSK